MAERAQDSRVLAVAIARGQPIGAMEFRSPAQERKTVWRWLGVADEHAIDVDVEVTSRAVRHTGVLIDPIVIWDSYCAGTAVGIPSVPIGLRTMQCLYSITSSPSHQELEWLRRI